MVRERNTLGDQVNVKLAVDVREYIEEWAVAQHFRAGQLCRILIEEAVRTHCSTTGDPLPPSLAPPSNKQARGGSHAPKKAAAGRR